MLLVLDVNDNILCEYMQETLHPWILHKSTRQVILSSKYIEWLTHYFHQRLLLYWCVDIYAL